MATAPTATAIGGLETCLAAGLDLDVAYVIVYKNLYLSFDGGDHVGGVTFSEGDLLK